MSIDKYLDKFDKRLKQQAKSNLTKSGSNDTKKLYDSFKSEKKVSKNSFSYTFYMERYGAFINEGVRGVGGVRKTTSKFNKKNNKGKLWKIKSKNSRFKFTKATGGISPKHFEGWAKRRGLSHFAVAKAVYHQGIEANHFLDKAFNSAFKTFPEEVVEAYGLEVEDFLKFAINK